VGYSGYCGVLFGTTGYWGDTGWYWGALRSTKGIGVLQGTVGYCNVLWGTIGYWGY